MSRAHSPSVSDNPPPLGRKSNASTSFAFITLLGVSAVFIGLFVNTKAYGIAAALFSWDCFVMLWLRAGLSRRSE